MPQQQLAFPFARDHEDEADAIARMLTAKIINVIQAMGFRWPEGADVAIARVRTDIAADLRTRLKEGVTSEEMK